MQEHREKNGDLARKSVIVPNSRIQEMVIMKRFKHPAKSRLFANANVRGVDETDGDLTHIYGKCAERFPP